ncbi:MAG TPA: AAA family ATPase [Trebonia sp.]|jgi:hypothetical protein|nr:AAA family ATPase [Trebonia sp.]
MTLSIKLRTLAEIQAETDGEELFLVPGLVSSEITMLVGEQYAGKTHYVLDLIKSATDGTPLLGVDPLRRIPKVAYLTTDAYRAVGANAEKAGIRPGVMLLAPVYAEDLKERSAWLELRDMLKMEGVGMTVIDSTTDLAEDVNSPASARLVTDGLRTLAESGCVVLNVHHRNKSGGIMGSNQFDKVARLKVELNRKANASTGTLVTTSNDTGGLTIPVAYNPDGAPFFTPAGAAKARTRDRAPETLDRNAEIAAFVAEGHSQREAALRFGMGVSTVNGILKRVRADRTEQGTAQV